MIHLINNDLTFNENLKSFYNEIDFHPPNKEYHTLAIIGCQSSGKSTFLNHVFNTTFEVMDEDKGRGQTTQGVWTAVNKEINTIIYDVEGTDAKERGDDRFRFEQCSSLFALAMADVLVINMWTSDIGRYTASNYGVLKIVFEMNLRLFSQESEKKIVIVLRDFDEDTNNLKSLQEAILGDLKIIWKEIKKPEKFANCDPEQFFRFEFLTLPHKFYFEEKFNKGIELIKQMLKKSPNKEGIGNGYSNDKAFLFNHVNYEKNVPIDGMFKYTWDIWSCIINNKDLNIPNQKEMLARFRCNEIKDQSLLLVDSLIAALELESSMKTMPDFKEKCEAILSTASDNYDALAIDYVPHIYQDIRKQLFLSLSERLNSCFGNQSKRLIPEYQKTFRAALEAASKETDDFIKCSREVKAKYLDQLNQEIKKIAIFEAWESQEIEDIFDEIIDNLRGRALEEKKSEILKKVRTFIEDCLLNKLEAITSEFWLEINQETLQYFQIIVLPFQNYLIDYYGMKQEDFQSFITPLEEEIYQSLKKDFNKKAKNLANYAVENFRKTFWYIEGIPRVWNKLSEGFIKGIFEQYNKENMFIFDLFKEFRLIKNQLQLVNYSVLSPEETNKINTETIPSILNNPEAKYERLLNDDEMKVIKLKYDDAVNELYEDAMRRQANITKQHIPLWAWILLIYVGYEDIYKIISGYWLIPVIILTALYGVLHMAGLGHLPKMILNLISGQLSSLFSNRNKN